MQCEIPKIPLYPAYTPTPDPLEWGEVGMLNTDGVGDMDGFLEILWISGISDLEWWGGGGYAGNTVDLRAL